jgi:hypothetical protein
VEGPATFTLDEECNKRRGVMAAALQDGFGEHVVWRPAGLKG